MNTKKVVSVLGNIGKTADLKSSVAKQGKVVTQIIQFSGGNKKTIRGVLSDTIEQSQFTKFVTIDDKLFFINDKNVDWFEVHAEKTRDKTRRNSIKESGSA